MATICLNMIVKNEAHVILRCLASAKPLIDYWVIVDTGSSDGTQDLIRHFLADVPGELHERPWRNFGHNRNEALDLARSKADYVLMIDADETFLVPENFQWPALTASVYGLQVEYGDMHYERHALIHLREPWRWEGVIHEYLTAPEPHSRDRLSAPRVFVRHDGARAHDPSTYDKDVALLEQALRDDPDNTRYQFYLAQSYRDAGRLHDALAAYQRRATMGGWEEEAWYAAFQAATCREAQGAEAQIVVDAYLLAWERRPSRIEPLHALTRYLRLQGRYELAAALGARGISIRVPSDDLLFIDRGTYDWRMTDEYAVACSYLPDQRRAGFESLQSLIARRVVPAQEMVRMRQNLAFFESHCPPLAAERRPVAITCPDPIQDLARLGHQAEALRAQHPERLVRAYVPAPQLSACEQHPATQAVDEWRDYDALAYDLSLDRLGPCLAFDGSGA